MRSHATHVPPPTPQVASDVATQTPLAQQPIGQVIALQTHVPPMHIEPMPQEAFPWQVHAPLHRRSLVPRERRFVIGALGDRICPPAHAATLWEHWERPRMHWYPGGHLAQFRRGRVHAEVRSFLAGLGVARA